MPPRLQRTCNLHILVSPGYRHRRQAVYSLKIHNLHRGRPFPNWTPLWQGQATVGSQISVRIRIRVGPDSHLTNLPPPAKKHTGSHSSDRNKRENRLAPLANPGLHVPYPEHLVLPWLLLSAVNGKSAVALQHKTDRGYLSDLPGYIE